MIWEEPAPPQELQPCTWCFLKPAQCRLRRPDGTEVLVGYGIGDKVDVMQPPMVYCLPPNRLKKEVVLADGSAIVAWPEDICVIKEQLRQEISPFGLSPFGQDAIMARATKQPLKEHWCQEKLEFCRGDGSANEAHQEVARILAREIAEAETKEFAQSKWEEAGRPEGRDVEFWLAAEQELQNL